MREQLPIARIVGKGPSLNSKVVRRRDEVLAALNSAILACDRVDYWFINDFESLDGLQDDEFRKAKSLIIPTYPHHKIPCDSVPVGYRRGPSPDRNWQTLAARIPESCRPEIRLYELKTAPLPTPDVETFGIVNNVAETAVAWLLRRGYRRFRTVGIDFRPNYSPLVGGGALPPDANEDLLAGNLANVLGRVAEAGGKISFDSMKPAAVLALLFEKLQIQKLLQQETQAKMALQAQLAGLEQDQLRLEDEKRALERHAEELRTNLELFEQLRFWKLRKALLWIPGMTKLPHLPAKPRAAQPQ